MVDLTRFSDIGRVTQSPSKEWIAVVDSLKPIVIIYQLSQSKTGLIPELKVSHKIECVRWANHSDKLAVSDSEALLVSKPPFRDFKRMTSWSFIGRTIVFEALKWFEDDSWLLRYVKYFDSSTEKDATWRFECFDVKNLRLVSIRESFQQITTAEWLDDRPIFAINVVSENEENPFQTIYFDAKSGRTVDVDDL